MEAYLALISFEAIFALPWYIQFPGLLAVVVLVGGAVRYFFTLHFVRCVSSLILAAAVLILLSQFGGVAARFIEGAPETEQTMRIAPAAFHI